MTDDKRIRQLFDIVAQAPPERRAEVAAHVCGGEEALQRKVLEMFGAAEAADVSRPETESADPVAEKPDPSVEPVAEAPPATPPESPAAADEQAGDQIGPYKLLQQIGEGGFGVVWMAEQREPVKRRVAVKVIKLGMDTKQVVARFMAERQALAMMDHPNIAKVFDAGSTEKGRPYFVMEYIKGVAITDYCDTERLDTTRRLELFRLVCHAIQHAHQKGIIHRDIKPSNVLVTMHDGVPVPKVIDFGVAKATTTELTQQTLFTEHRQMVGTPTYMSPEQAEMSGLDIDTRADVYSLGVLLYELLTGTTPFDIKTLLQAGYSELMRVIREEEPQKPSTCFRTLDETATRYAERRRADARKLGQALRGDLDWIVMKCLEKDRTRRYETANGLAEDIRRYLGDEPVVAGPPSASYRLRKFVKRNRGQVLASTAVLASLVAGIVGFAWQAREARDQRDDAVTARKSEAEQRRLAQQQAKLAKEQEAAAKIQTEIAQAIANFQTRMLSAADPNRLLGDSVTVLQVLVGAVEELDGGVLAGQPLVEANVRAAIGDTFLELGRAAEAETQHRRSLRLFQDSLPALDLEIASAQNRLAICLWRGEKVAEAEQLYRHVLASYELGDSLRSSVQGNLSSLLLARGDLEEATDLARASLATTRSELAADDPELATVVIKLGGCLEEAGREEEAVSLYREALAIRRKVLPAQHPFLAGALANLGRCLLDQSELEEAEACWREALSIERASLPEGHARIGRTCSWMAQLLIETHRDAEAEPLLREQLAIQREDPRVAGDVRMLNMRKLGALLIRKGEFDEAATLLQESLMLARQARPVPHGEVASTLEHLAALEKQRGNVGASEAFAREYLASARVAWEDNDPRVARAHNALGLALWDARRLDEALEAFREALTLRREVLPADDPEIAVTLHNVGGVLRDMGRFDEAEPPLREALASWRRAYPQGHRDVRVGLNGLAMLLQMQQKLDDAEKLLREAATMASPGESPSDTSRVNGQLNLIKLLAGRGKLAEAGELLREVTEGEPLEQLAKRTQVANAFSALGFMHWRRGELDRSIPMFEQALAANEARHGRGHFETRNSVANLGVNLRDAGRLEEAIPLLEEAARAVAQMPRLAFVVPQLFETYVQAADPADPESIARVVEMSRGQVEAARKARAAGSPGLAIQLTLLARQLLRAGVPATAEPLCREVLSIREQTGPQQWPTFHAKAMLGQALLASGQHEASEPLLLQGYRGMKEREAQIPQAAQAWVVEALEQIVKLYTAKGDGEEAKIWQRKLDTARGG